MKLKIFAAFAATIMVTASCGILGGAASNAGTAGAASKATGIGAALAGIYTQYKTDGKLDLTNLTTIINIASVLNDLKGIKGATTNALQSADFVNGLISGSKNLVNQANSASIVSGLTTLAGLDLSSITNAANKINKGTEEAAQAAVGKINTTSDQMTTAINALSGIMKAFK